MKKTYHIITIGCQMNEADSERIASYLEFYGFKHEPKRSKAGLVVLNTCGIRQTAESRNYGLIPLLKKENKNVKIILAGCLSERPDVRRRLEDRVDIWLPIQKLPELYKQLGLKKKSFGKGNYLNIEPKAVSPFSVYIPVGNGCDNFCAYCVVPYARGREQYRSAYEIFQEAEKFIAKGYKELTLIAQNVNSYRAIATKADLKYFPHKKIGDQIFFWEVLLVTGVLPEILATPAKGKAKIIPNNYWVRFSTSHPKDMGEDLIRVTARGGRFAPHIHLPVQAGDNQILSAMNRKYSVEHYLGLTEKIKKAIPEVGLSSDIIVGFPGETRKQFANTLKLAKKVKYDMIYMAQFSPRPGTAAFKMKDNVTAIEKKRREEELNEVLKKTALENNQKFLNREIVVLVEEKNAKGKWLGKNGQMKTVIISGASDKKLAGRFCLVKISEVKDFGLYGEFVK